MALVTHGNHCFTLPAPHEPEQPLFASSTASDVGRDFLIHLLHTITNNTNLEQPLQLWLPERHRVRSLRHRGLRHHYPNATPSRPSTGSTRLSPSSAAKNRRRPATEKHRQENQFVTAGRDSAAAPPASPPAESYCHRSTSTSGRIRYRGSKQASMTSKPHCEQRARATRTYSVHYPCAPKDL